MIRFGVVGLRRGESFVRVCQAAQGAEVTALYDVDHARLTQESDRLGLGSFTDFDDFLNADIDAVVVASPEAFHVSQSVAALASGKHVLCEVTASQSLDEARHLVAAARSSDAIYMLAENYRYRDEVELLKRLNDDGRFGNVYYGEGEYLHDCRDLWYNPDGTLAWRALSQRVYCTHSLGPLLYVTGDRVSTVSAMAVPGQKFDDRVSRPTQYLLNMQTVGGITLRVRVDNTSPRPHKMDYYAIQGMAGAFESFRGGGDVSKLWLADQHEPSRVGRDSAQWHPASEFAERYIPDRLAAPPEASLGGHGTSEYWMLRDFLAAVRGEQEIPIDVYRGLDYTLPGVVSIASAQGGGTPHVVPDPRQF